MSQYLRTLKIKKIKEDLPKTWVEEEKKATVQQKNVLSSLSTLHCLNFQANISVEIRHDQ